MTLLENNQKNDLPDKSSTPGNSYAEKGSNQLTELPSSEEKSRAESLATFIGRSESVLWMKKFIEKIAPLEVNVLITEPSGSGKTLVAEIIHSLSRRSDKPFVKVDCSSIPEEAFELAVFGPEKDLPNGMAQDELGKIGEVRGGCALHPNRRYAPQGAKKVPSFLRNSQKASGKPIRKALRVKPAFLEPLFQLGRLRG